MKIIDAQIHDVGPWYDWATSNPETQHQLLTELVVAYLDAVGVQGVLLFPGGETESAAFAAASLPARFAYVPPIAPDMPDIDGTVLRARKLRDNGLIALRAIVGWPLDGREVQRFDAGAWDPIFAACERHEVPVFLFITRWLTRVADLAAKYPRLKIVLDHLGLSQPPLDEAEQPPFKSLPQLLQLAEQPNLYVKLCGLPALSQQPYPYPDLTPHLRAIVDAFGADRLMWASDTTRFAGRIGLGRFQNPRTIGEYPGKHTYAESLHFIRDHGALTTAEKKAILGGTVRRVLQWPAGA